MLNLTSQAITIKITIKGTSTAKENIQTYTQHRGTNVGTGLIYKL